MTSPFLSLSLSPPLSPLWPSSPSPTSLAVTVSHLPFPHLPFSPTLLPLSCQRLLHMNRTSRDTLLWLHNGASKNRGCWMKLIADERATRESTTIEVVEDAGKNLAREGCSDTRNVWKTEGRAARELSFPHHPRHCPSSLPPPPLFLDPPFSNSSLPRSPTPFPLPSLVSMSLGRDGNIRYKNMISKKNSNTIKKYYEMIKTNRVDSFLLLK